MRLALLTLALAVLVYWPLVLWALECPVMHAAACNAHP